MPRISVRRPSPAMMVALTALFVALGGSSYAAITLDGRDIKHRSVAGTKLKANSVRGSEIANGSLTRSDFQAAALPVEPLYAVVRDDGSLFAAKGVVTASKLCPSCRQYDITFNTDVSRCAAVATIGGNPNFAFQERGELQVFTNAPPRQNQVRVIHHDSGGGSGSDGVYLIAASLYMTRMKVLHDLAPQVAQGTRDHQRTRTLQRSSPRSGPSRDSVLAGTGF